MADKILDQELIIKAIEEQTVGTAPPSFNDLGYSMFRHVLAYLLQKTLPSNASPIEEWRAWDINSTPEERARGRIERAVRLAEHRGDQDFLRDLEARAKRYLQEHDADILTRRKRAMKELLRFAAIAEERAGTSLPRSEEYCAGARAFRVQWIAVLTIKCIATMGAGWCDDIRAEIFKDPDGCLTRAVNAAQEATNDGRAYTKNRLDQETVIIRMFQALGYPRNQAKNLFRDVE